MIRILKALFVGAAILTWVVLLAWFLMGERLEQKFKETQSEIVGTVADRYIAKNTDAPNRNTTVKTVAGLHNIAIKVDQYLNNIYRASGVANSYLIKTTEGNVLFDTGLATQGAKHKRLLQNAAPGDITHIILSHSHADHIGATKFWKAEFPNAKIITHRKFPEGQRYLTELQDHFWNRNRLLYTFMPETPPEDDSLFAYGGIKPDILVDESQAYQFRQGGVDFIVHATPGAEGDDNIVLWLPQQKALFSGDFFGPLFPMVPNLFTLRGEKFRDPIAYLHSLEKVLGLNAEIVLPSHFDPVLGEDQIAKDIGTMRDVTRYIHDQTITGMNQGKSVWQLMQDIKLPDEINISQGHGKVSWNVRSIWEYYSTWFKFESTTELYPIPVTTLYPEIAALAGGSQALLALAEQKLNANKLEQVLHLVEIAMADSTDNSVALELKLKALDRMLNRAWENGSNYSETGWLTSQINLTQRQINSLVSE